MRHFSCFATTHAPREVVWRILSDVVAWPRWLPTVERIETLDGDELRVGARFVVHQPALRPATWKVAEVVEPESFTWEARMPGLLMIADHRVRRVSAVESQVQLKFSFEGLLGGIAGVAYGGITQRYLAQEAAALTIAAEKKEAIPA